EVRASAKPFCEPWCAGAWRAHENIRQLCSQSVSNCSQTVCLAFTHEMAQKQRHEISLRSYWADLRDQPFIGTSAAPPGACAIAGRIAIAKDDRASDSQRCAVAWAGCDPDSVFFCSQTPAGAICASPSSPTTPSACFDFVRSGTSIEGDPSHRSLARRREGSSGTGASWPPAWSRLHCRQRP